VVSKTTGKPRYDSRDSVIYVGVLVIVLFLSAAILSEVLPEAGAEQVESTLFSNVVTGAAISIQPLVEVGQRISIMSWLLTALASVAVFLFVINVVKRMHTSRNEEDTGVSIRLLVDGIRLANLHLDRGDYKRVTARYQRLSDMYYQIGKPAEKYNKDIVAIYNQIKKSGAHTS